MDVAAWLRGLGLERYEAAFRDNQIDWAVLPELTSEDLREIGVVPIGHRRKLLASIAGLGATGTAASEAERRQLTVMFCDLVGSTELSARLDPEDLREVITAYHPQSPKSSRALTGLSPSIWAMACWLISATHRAHEDDAEHAVRAGLGVIHAVGRLDIESVKLQARVGIATGLVVVGDLIGEGSAQEQSVVGETPNLAARLQALAEPDAVVIAASTRRLVGDLFEFRDLGAVEVKGIVEPVPAWQVLRPSAVASRFEALRGSGLTRLVGRDEEIELLLRRWESAKTGEGQVVLVSGEPGLGKSRIAVALRERIQDSPHFRQRYFCSPYRQDSALYPVHRADRTGGWVRTRQIHRQPSWRSSKPCSPAHRYRMRTQPFSPTWCHCPASERYPLPNLSPQRKKERTLEALIRRLEGLAYRQPVVKIVEDAHWIDPTSRELLDLTVERVRSLPVLLIVTFRPEFQPTWSGEPHVTMLVLNRLNRRARSALVEQIAGGQRIAR